MYASVMMYACNLRIYACMYECVYMCMYVVCLKSKCIDFLFKCLLDSHEITSYLLQSYTMVPTFFPLIIAVPKVIFCKCV